MATPDLTQALLRWRSGDPAALEELLPHVYDEMRRLAGGYMRRERVDHTLQPTALVHEAFIRLTRQREVSWQNRAHFMAIAARAMRRVLADHARRNGALKRGGGAKVVTLDDSIEPDGSPGVTIDELDAILEDLARIDARQARIVEMRFFGGLSIEEAAEVVGVSPATVKRDWALARAWLHRELSGRVA